ncbi:MAG: hypothetical protein CVU61_02130 [Deltaproteobacteria bacterium HGW-Deltaproteobacteria-19]|jgi:hypothetical protein|nr:MAG: hypothetical protein CVU61_02130 [Deltaproteobacteria bacterium HGW-Deltaproteobacteria-19]
MDQEAIKKRYDALQPLPETGWDYTWIDRLRTWEDFLEKGLTVSVGLRQLQISAANYEGIRGLCPGLHDLVLDAYPVTPEIQVELDQWKEELGFIE